LQARFWPYQSCFLLLLCSCSYSFWNFIDLLSYGANLVIMPCVLFRYNIDQREFVPPMVSKWGWQQMDAPAF
jgi:hypothetical protein